MSSFSSFDNIPSSSGDDPTTTPDPPLSPRAPIIIFGSQGSDFLGGLDAIFALSRYHSELSTFLSLALDAVRVEYKSIANRRDERFPSAMGISKVQRESEVELLPLLAPFEAFSDLTSLVKFPSPKPSQGSGALSAFTLRTLTETIGIWAYAQEAIKAIRIAFWIGLRSSQARARLTREVGSNACSGPWSIVVAVKDPDDIEKVYLRMSMFNELEQRRPLDQPAALVVTARAVNQLSIGGSPEQLDHFKAYLLDHLESKCRVLPLEIFSPYHSPDLEAETAFVMLDLERRGVIDDSELQPSLKLLWETAKSNVLEETTTHGALNALISSNLCSTAEWDAMIDRLLMLEEQLPESDPLGSGLIVSFGPGSTLANDLKKRLSEHGQQSLSPEALRLVDVPLLCWQYTTSAALFKPEAPFTVQTDIQGEEVVIVSMACRFPGDVRTPDQLWTCLETGRSTVSEIPAHLFNVDDYFGEGKNQTMARHMHALPENIVKSMDARLFSMSPKEIEQLDPQHRLVMLCSYEALERAGYSHEANSPSSFDSKRIAVCMGASWDDYRENASWNIGSYFITGNIRAFIPGHVSFSLKWEGPSVSVDSLECSAVSALQWSRRALLSEQCDVALAGAVNVLTQPQLFIAMDKEGVLSHSGTNATFSSSLDGKTRGDGCGVLLLKRRSTALQDGDKILATLPAARTTYHGQTKGSDDTSSIRQSCFLAQVMSEAGLNASDLAHIEASGSHAQQEEAVEFDAFARLLKHPSAGLTTSMDGGISVASSRPNIGAGEAVSAITSVMKAVLMLAKGSVPRQISISHPSQLQPSIAATCANSLLFVPVQAQLLPSSNGQRGRNSILVNSLASTGCHGAVLVKAPTIDNSTPCQRQTNVSPSDACAWVFVLSAKTKESGEMLRKDLIAYLQREVCLADLSYTLACRRSHHAFRLGVVASDQEELVRRLRVAEFVEAKLPSSLPAISLMIKIPDLSPLASQSMLSNMTVGLRDRYEELLLATGLLKPRISADSQLILRQICIASLLEDCGLHPIAVGGNLAPFLHSSHSVGGPSSMLLCDKQSFIQALCELDRTCADARLQTSSSKANGEEMSPEMDNVRCLSSLPPLKQRVIASLDQDQKKASDRERRVDSTDNLPCVVVAESVKLLGVDKLNADPSPETASEAERLQRSLLSSLASLHIQGYAIHWIEYFRPYLHQLNLVDTLPTYPFHLQRYWMEYHDRNLLQHIPPSQVASTAAEAGVKLCPADTVQASGDVKTFETPTQPLLTMQLGADSRASPSLSDWTYASDTTGEAYAALLESSTPHAMAAELLEEAVREASASFVQVSLASGSHSLCLNNLELREMGQGKEAKTVRLDVTSHRGECLGRRGFVQMHDGAAAPRIAAAQYHWLSEEALKLRWSRLQGRLREKIHRIESDGEMFAARLIYKSILKEPYPAAAIQRAYAEAQSQEVVVHIRRESQSDPCITEARCVLPLLLPALEDCARWSNSTINHDQAEHDLVSIGEMVFREDWLVASRRSMNSMRSYTVYISRSERPSLLKSPLPEATLDMLLMDEDLSIVGELNRVELEKLQAGRGRPISQPEIVSAPIMVGGSSTPASSAPFPKLDGSTLHASSDPSLRKNHTAERQSSRAVDLHVKILDVLASELGIAIEEMKPSIKFADLGLDSLMSLVCISTLDSLHLGFEVPQSLFMECDSPEELLAWIREQVGDFVVDDVPKSVPDQTSAAHTSPCPTQPETSSSSIDVARDSHSAEPPQGSSALDDVMRTITSTIEIELGVGEGSIAADANLADLGLDSLMSLLVIGNLSSTLPLELPSSLFMDCSSLGEIRAYLASKLGSCSADVEQPLSPVGVGRTPSSFSIPAAKKPTLLRAGTRTDCDTPLFLLPDGSGMSTVYQFFYAIDRPIYSINSPFLGDATAWNGGIAQVAQYYAASIKLIQPTGPYLVGGWSFGGMAAFEIANFFARTPGPATDRVRGLFFLDTPCPALYPPLPMSIVDWISTAREVKDIAPPALSEKLVAHFRATVGSIDGWRPTPFQADDPKVPNVWYVVADHPLPGRIQDVKEVNDTVRWLFQSDRAAKNGPDGWDEYIPAKKMRVVPLAEANHFTLVREPAVVKVAEILQIACREALQS